jgi:multiple sugar transport system permease protein
MNKFQQRLKAWTPYLLLSPGLVLMVLIVGFPIFRSFNLSFFNYILWKPYDIRFIGLENYMNVLKDPAFKISLINTLFWVGLGVALQFVFGLVLALLLNQNFKGRGLTRSLSLIPWITPGILIGLIWQWMYDGNHGLINDLLVKMHIIREYVPWLAQANTALPALIVTIIWQGIPFFAIMLLASLQSIPEEMYEASEIDGASKIQAFKYITLPYLLPTIVITTILRIIWVANSVDIIYIMTGGGPGFSTLTLAVYTYIKAQKVLDFGYAATLSIYLTIIICVALLIYLKLLNRNGKEDMKQ